MIIYATIWGCITWKSLTIEQYKLKSHILLINLSHRLIRYIPNRAWSIHVWMWKLNSRLAFVDTTVDTRLCKKIMATVSECIRRHRIQPFDWLDTLCIQNLLYLVTWDRGPYQLIDWSRTPFYTKILFSKRGFSKRGFSKRGFSIFSLQTQLWKLSPKYYCLQRNFIDNGSRKGQFKVLLVEVTTNV